MRVANEKRAAMRGVFSARIVSAAVRIGSMNAQLHHQQKYSVRRFAGKKRKKARNRQQRGGSFRTDWEPLDELSTSPANQQQQNQQSDGPLSTAAREMGWKSIVFILLAPIGAWGIRYAIAGPDLQQQMLRDLGFVENEEADATRLSVEAAPKEETKA